MKKVVHLFILMLLVVSAQAQQSVTYSQFMLNDYGLNPAVAGNSKGIMCMAGRRTQWRGFELSPVTNFASITRDIGKKKGYKFYWHGVGLYFEQDNLGIFTNTVASLSYAIHLKLSKKYYLSCGIAAGVKQAALIYDVDPNDVAVATRVKGVVVPDFIPGLYLSSKKFAMGLSVRNLYKNKLQDKKGEIGTPDKPSRLRPVAYLTVNRKFFSSGYDFIFVPSVNIQSTFVGIPISSFNFIAYYHKRVGLGLSYRMHDAMSMMLHVRIWKNVIVGFAYDYTISKFRNAHANSTEVMFGFSPVMGGDAEDRQTGSTNCPKFDY